MGLFGPSRFDDHIRDCSLHREHVAKALERLTDSLDASRQERDEQLRQLRNHNDAQHAQNTKNIDDIKKVAIKTMWWGIGLLISIIAWMVKDIGGGALDFLSHHIK